MIELSLGISAALVLTAYFVAFKTNWPGSYFALEDVLSQRVSVSPLRYSLFRFGPVVLVTAFVGVVAGRLMGSAGITALTAGGLHALISAGRAFVSVLRRRNLFARRSLLALHVVVFIGVLMASVVGALAASTTWMMNIVPPVSDLRSDLWTALLAAVLGAAFVRSTSGQDITPRGMIEYARRQVGPELLAYAREQAVAASTDPKLVEAILLVEVIQRPRWIRALERNVGGVFKFRTYGAMQVSSPRPLSDRESIDLAIANYLLGVQVSRIGYPPLRDVLRIYNQNPLFIDLAETIYNNLDWPSSEEGGPSGNLN